MKPTIKQFKEYMAKNKRVGLRLIYRDYNIKDDKERKRCRDAWEYIEYAMSKQKVKS
jgi:hypothetical protein